MALPLISVVIGTYNQKSVLERVLLSFLDQTLPKDQFEIVVVDSTSSDGTAEMVRGFEGRLPVRLWVQPNRGKAAARNRGATEAQSAILFFTDGDLIAHPQLLAEHVAAQQSAASPRCFEGLEYNMKTLDWPPTPQQLKPIVSDRVSHLQRIGWFYWLTGNVSVSRAIFLEHGGFDETFTGYGFEDIELGYRLHRAGIYLYYLKTAVNYHYHLITPELEVARAEHKGKSAALFYRKHPELKWYLGMNPVSMWVHAQLAPDGIGLQWAKKQMMRSGGLRYRVAAWLLHEYGYLSGAKTAIKTGIYQ